MVKNWYYRTPKNFRFTAKFPKMIRKFLLKLPGSRGSPTSVVIEINPVDALDSPTKKIEVVVRSAAELEWIKEILSNPKANELAEKNGQSKSSEERICF